MGEQTQRPLGDKPPLGRLPVMASRVQAVTAALVRKAQDEGMDPQEFGDYINAQMIGRNIDQIISELELTPQERAMVIIDEMEVAESLEEAMKLARQALELDPNNIDAQILIVQGSETEEEAVDAIRAIVRNAEQEMGREYMEENEGYFWGIPETRPYMRARLNLAIALADFERYEEAISEAEGLLKLCPNDNQGVRELVMGWYLVVGRARDARRLMDVTYKKDVSAVFLWGRAITYRRLGDKLLARKALRTAIIDNPHVIFILVGETEMVDSDAYQPGSVEEASYVLECLSSALAGDKELTMWLIEESIRIMKSRL